MKPREPTAIICLSPYHGGMEMDAIRTARLLQDFSDITIILKQGSPSEHHYRNALEQDGFTVSAVSFRSALSLSIILQVRKLIRNKRIRNVIFFGASELRSLFFAFLGLNINLVVRHGTTKTHPKKDPFHRLIYSRVNWHVAICQHIAMNVRKIIPFGKHTRLKIIYSSLRKPVPAHDPLLRKDNEPVEIVHVGRLTGGKGQIDAIRACGILEERGIPFRLQLVGEIDVSFRPELEDVLSKISYKDRIECSGHVQDPAPIFQNAHIFLFPSKGEGLSNAFMEALANGLVCIAYENTSFPELRDLGFTCHLAEDQNLSALKNCLIETVTDINNIETRRSNMMLAKKLFDPSREVREYCDLLQ